MTVTLRKFGPDIEFRYEVEAALNTLGPSGGGSGGILDGGNRTASDSVMDGGDRA